MTDLDSVRKVARGYHAAHVLAADSYQARANTAQQDDSSTAMIRQSLQLQAEREQDVAAQFGTLADLLDTATVRNPLHSNVIHCADGGAYIWDAEDEL